MANIKFQIFRNRKKFNIINWLKRSQDKSYDAFVEFLSSKSVTTPGKEYFQRALDLLASMEQREQQFQENKEQVAQEEPVQERKETVPVEVDIVLPPVQEDLSIEESPEEKIPVVEEQKPKTSRRRRKKTQSES